MPIRVRSVVFGTLFVASVGPACGDSSASSAPRGRSSTEDGSVTQTDGGPSTAPLDAGTTADGDDASKKPAPGGIWPREPLGATVLTEWAWNELAGDGWTTEIGNRSIVSDPTAPRSGDNVLECRRNPGETGGCTAWWASFPEKTNDIYVGFFWKVSNPFHGEIVNNQKIIYMQMQSRVLDLGMKGPPNGPFTLKFGVQGGDNGHRSECVEPGSCVLESNPLPISLGEWHQVEVFIRKSTTTTSRDGEFRMWLDGELGGAITNLNTGEVFEQFNFLQTWNGPTELPQSEWHRYDHVRISVPNGAPPR